MTSDKNNIAPEHTAVRVALWRALHVLIDSSPHIFSDTIGLKLVEEAEWRSRPDMNPDFSKGMRASVVGRARFIEDLVNEQEKLGVNQYVILGAGLDTFAQRRTYSSNQLQVYEIDQSGPQAWKQKRLIEVGYKIPEWLHFVPVDFEHGHSWWEKLIASGFDISKPAVVVSTGVSMYLTKEANLETFMQMVKLAKGSTFAMTFMLALDLLDREEKNIMEFVMKKTKEAGTPFLSLFTPSEIILMAKKVGFENSVYVSGIDLYQSYFAKRLDGLRAGNAEGFLVARN